MYLKLIFLIRSCIIEVIKHYLDIDKSYPLLLLMSIKNFFKYILGFILLYEGYSSLTFYFLNPSWHIFLIPLSVFFLNFVEFLIITMVVILISYITNSFSIFSSFMLVAFSLIYFIYELSKNRVNSVFNEILSKNNKINPSEKDVISKFPKVEQSSIFKEKVIASSSSDFSKETYNETMNKNKKIEETFQKVESKDPTEKEEPIEKKEESFLEKTRKLHINLLFQSKKEGNENDSIVEIVKRKIRELIESSLTAKFRDDEGVYTTIVKTLTNSKVDLFKNFIKYLTKENKLVDSFYTHFLVLAGTGAGKTYTTKYLIFKLIDYLNQIIIFDIKDAEFSQVILPLKFFNYTEEKIKKLKEEFGEEFVNHWYEYGLPGAPFGNKKIKVYIIYVSGGGDEEINSKVVEVIERYFQKNDNITLKFMDFSKPFDLSELAVSTGIFSIVNYFESILNKKYLWENIELEEVLNSLEKGDFSESLEILENKIFRYHKRDIHLGTNELIDLYESKTKNLNVSIREMLNNGLTPKLNKKLAKQKSYIASIHFMIISFVEILDREIISLFLKVDNEEKKNLKALLYLLFFYPLLKDDEFVNTIFKENFANLLKEKDPKIILFVYLSLLIIDKMDSFWNLQEEEIKRYFRSLSLEVVEKIKTNNLEIYSKEVKSFLREYIADNNVLFNRKDDEFIFTIILTSLKNISRVYPIMFERAVTNSMILIDEFFNALREAHNETLIPYTLTALNTFRSKRKCIFCISQGYEREDSLKGVNTLISAFQNKLLNAPALKKADIDGRPYEFFRVIYSITKEISTKGIEEKNRRLDIRLWYSYGKKEIDNIFWISVSHNIPHISKDEYLKILEEHS